MSLYDKASLIFSGAAGAGANDVAYNIKPVEKLKVDELITNNKLLTSDGWSFSDSNITVASGKIVFNNAAQYATARWDTDVFEEGKTYRVSFKVEDFKGGASNSKLLAQQANNTQINTEIDRDGNYSFYYTPGAPDGTTHQNKFQLKTVTASLEAKVSDFSIKEVEQKANDLSFVRASNLTATYEGPDGLIKKKRENLLVYSNQFDNTDTGIWTNGNAPTVTANQSGYDGTTNAFKLTKDTGLYRRVEQNVTSISGVYTLSVYAKADTLSAIALRNGGTNVGGLDRVEFNLANGTFTLHNNSVAGNMEPITGEAGDTDRWYRCSATFTDASTQMQIYVDIGESVAGSVFIQNAQLEQGLVATPYIDRTGAAYSTAGIREDEPRYDYSLDNDAPPALLYEPERQNLLAHSEYFTFEGRTTITYNHDTSPDGFKNSTRYSNTTENGNHRTYSSSFDVTSGDTYTISVFGKKGTLKNLSFKLKSGNEGDFGDDGVTEIVTDEPIFDLNAASISGDSSNASMIDYGNGWYRCILTTNANTDITGARVYFYFRKDDGTKSYTGATSENMELYGMQVEKGSCVSSYIPTYGSAGTRKADLIPQ